MKTRSIYLNSDVQRGALVYIEARKGLRAKVARFFYKLFKWEWLHNLGYGASPLMVGDSKTPIGIALDESTVLISGRLEIPAPPAGFTKGEIA